MSGFFRGPSLFTHVLVVAACSAVAVPLFEDRLDSWPVTLGVWFAGVLLYAIAAVAFASRRP